MIIHEQDVHSRFDISVLEGIVEQYDVNVVLSLAFGELPDAMTALAVNSYGDVVAILAFHLQRFVAHGSCRRLVIDDDETSCASLVTTA